MTQLEEERNKKIKKLYEKGLTYAEIGKRFDLSRQRIHQIVGKSGYVYLLKCDKYYKIGSTARPERRINHLSTGIPFEIKIIAISKQAKNYKIIEFSLQKKFCKKKYRGEWYLLNESDIETLKQAIEAPVL